MSPFLCFLPEAERKLLLLLFGKLGQTEDVAPRVAMILSLGYFLDVDGATELLRYLDAKEAKERWAACAALRLIFDTVDYVTVALSRDLQHTQHILEAIAELLRTEKDTLVAGMGFEAMRALAEKEAQCSSAYITMLGTEYTRPVHDPYVRNMCAQFLGATGRTSAIPELLKALSDVDASEVRYSAAIGLRKVLEAARKRRPGNQGIPHAADAAMALIARAGIELNDDDELAAECVRALGLSGDPRAFDQLEAWAGSNVPAAMAHACIKALVQLDAHRAKPVLTRLADTGSDAVKPFAANALAELQ